MEAELARRLVLWSYRAGVSLWVEPARTFILTWHIAAMAEHLQAVSEGRDQTLLINVPPGHPKSLIDPKGNSTCK
jgi:hypothetical protein